MKSVHNPCPYGNDDCPKCNMKTTTPSRENWEIEFKNKFPRHGYDNIHENEFHSQLMLDFIRNLLQSHNNALVAEIEKMKLVGTEYVGHLNSEGFNRALDTIIRIIQEK